MAEVKELGPLFPNTYKSGKLLYTMNAYPGKKHFDEKTLNWRGREYRQWSPNRSKLAAAILKGLKDSGFREGCKALYLGAGHGYTPSFVSDMVGKEGMLFCVENSPTVLKELLFLCEERGNMAPLLADANHPERYAEFIPGRVDSLYQDVAQRNQVEIFLKNKDAFLKNKGFAMLAVKARCIDVTKNPKEIFSAVLRELKQHVEVLDVKNLAPYEKDHAFFLCKN